MKKTKFSKVVAVLFALIMVFTSIPVQALAASPTDLNIQDGKVVLFSDTNEDQVKQQLFNALVTNKEGYNYQDYEWEYGCNGYNWANAHKWKRGSVNGFVTKGNVFEGNFTHPALKDNKEVDENGSWEVNLTGRQDKIIRVTKTALHVNYNYDDTKGQILVNDNKVQGAVNVTSLNDLKFKVVANEGVNVESVTIGGKPASADPSGYYILPIDNSNVDVNVNFVKSGFGITVKYSDLGTVTLDGQTVSKDGLKVYKTGEYTLNAVANEGAKFVGWSVNGKLVSTNVSFTANAYQDITYVPVFEVTDAADKFTVTFLDCWNNIISTQEVSNASEIQIPQGINYNGYTFSGWSLSNEEIANLTSSATITALVKKSATGFTLTSGDAEVTFEEIKNGEELVCGKLENGQYLCDTEITVTKQGAASWYINDSKEPVAFGETFTFFIGSDTTVTYKTETAEGRTTVSGISTNRIDGSYKVSFLATRHIGANDTIVSSGFVYGKNMNEEDLVLEKVGDKGSNAESGTVKSAYSSNMSTDAQMSLNYGISSATGAACARPFVVIQDADGAEKVVYGSMMTYNY